MGRRGHGRHPRLSVRALVLVALVLAPAAALLAPASSGGAGVAFTAPVVLDVTQGSGEPGLVIDGQGTLYASILDVGSDDVYKSLDRGATWVPIRAVDAGFGGGDNDLALDDAGNLYLAGQWGTTDGCMSMSTSKTGGLGWVESPAVCRGAPAGALSGSVDRPWVATYTPPGALLPDVFMLHHAPCCAGTHVVERSTDGGLTFTDAGTTTTTGGFPGNLVMDEPRGVLYEFFPSWSPFWGPAVSRSTDLGLTWTQRPVAMHLGATTGLDRVTGAVDRAGNLYVVWSEDRGSGYQVFLSTSQDRGDSWTAPVQLSAGGTNVYPWPVAGAPGKLDVAWYNTTKVGDPNAMNTYPAAAWYVSMAQSLDALSATPHVAQGLVSPVPNHLLTLCTQGAACSTNRDLLDFFKVALDADGDANVVWAQDVNKPLAAVKTTTVDEFARQVSGPGLN